MRDGTGKHLSFTVLLDAPAWNSCLLDGIHGKYIIKRYEKRLHCIGPSCNTEQYLFRYGLLCRDPEYGIEGSEMHWHHFRGEGITGEKAYGILGGVNAGEVPGFMAQPFQ